MTNPFAVAPQATAPQTQPAAEQTQPAVAPQDTAPQTQPAAEQPQATPAGSPFGGGQATPAGSTFPGQAAAQRPATPVGVDQLSISGIDISKELEAANKRVNLSDMAGRQVLIHVTSVMSEWQAPRGVQRDVPIVDIWPLSDPIAGLGDQTPAGTLAATNVYITNVKPKLILKKKFESGAPWAVATVSVQTRSGANGQSSRSVDLVAEGVTQETIDRAQWIMQEQAKTAAAAGGN